MSEKCHCGLPVGRISYRYVETGCAGTGYRNCFCGGDFCCCHLHGGIECEALGYCDECAPPEESHDDEPDGALLTYCALCDCLHEDSDHRRPRP